jgi:actin-related protein
MFSLLLCSPSLASRRYADERSFCKHSLTSAHFAQNPVERGAVTNWDDFETALRHIFSHLELDASTHPILIGEPPLNPRVNREKLTEVLFESFQTPAMYVALTGILGLFSSGRTTGLVVDSGHDVTQIVPVYDGHTLPHAIQRYNFGGRDVGAMLKTKLLTREEDPLADLSDADAQAIKEQHGRVAADYDEELARAQFDEETWRTYTLPDGQTVTLKDEPLQCGETLFKPDLLELWEQKGIHAAIAATILKCDLDTRRDLFENIVIGGGNTLYPGFAERLKQEVVGLATQSMRVNVVQPGERQFAAWKGGAVFATLPTIDDLWIPRSEYDEIGPDVVHRECISVTDRSEWKRL